MPPRGEYGDHFKYGERVKRYYKCWCKACLKIEVERLRGDDQLKRDRDPSFPVRSAESIQIAAEEAVAWISSNPDGLRKHLSECQNVEENVRTQYSETVTPRAKPTTVARVPKAPPVTLVPVIPPVPPTNPQIVTQIQWNEAATTKFNRDLLRVIASTDSAFNIVHNRMFRDFLQTYAGNPPIASASTLRKVYLKGEINQIEATSRQMMKGKFAMGQCDGWTNKVAKTALVAILVKVEGETFVRSLHDVSAERKTAENLLNLVLVAILELQNADVEVVGWVSDAGGDSRAMRLKLSELMPQMIILDCWAHQINLVVGDYFKLKGVYTETIENAIRLIRWFNSHLGALALLRTAQVAEDGKTRALIEPCLTRWTSHYHSMNRLRSLKTVLQRCWADHRPKLQQAGGEKPEQRKATEAVSRLIADEEMWDNIDSACKHLHPLAVASNMTQGSRGALYSVVLTLANLYRIYSSDAALDANVKMCLLGSIEKRWAKTDQDSFLAAIVLNPYIRQKLFKSGSLYSSIGSVYELFARLWERFFKREVRRGFFQIVVDYCSSKGPFTDKAMFLEDQIDHLMGMNFNILQVWTVLDDKTDIGKNQLVKLAIRIHAAVANSADCERFFSQMGAIHTKRRSRLDPQVVRDLAVVKMSIQQEFKEDTLNQRKRKREEFEEAHPLASKRSRSSKMRSIPTQTADAATSAGPSATTTHPDESEDTDTDETEGEEEVPMSTRALVTALTTAADGDDTADDMVSFDAGQLDPSLLSQLNGNPPTPTPTSASMPSPSPSLSNSDRHFFGTQQVSRIEDLFDFSEDTIEMWQDIGHYGEVRYQNEEEELENWSRESTAKLEDLG